MTYLLTSHFSTVSSAIGQSDNVSHSTGVIEKVSEGDDGVCTAARLLLDHTNPLSAEPIRYS
jgi:hypothetical protein